MRLSLRKVVKLTTFLMLVILLNVWISYTVNVWSFNNFDDRGKLSQTSGRAIDGDKSNGGAIPLPPVRRGHGIADIEKENRSLSDFMLFRNQRSAKEINVHDESANKQHISFDASTQTLVAHHKNKLKNLLLLSSESGGAGEHISSSGKNINSVSYDKELRDAQEHESRQSEETELKDIFISVKTTSKYHGSRVKLLLQTWYLLAREEVYFFSDADDSDIAETLGNHLINTNCSTDHSRRALSCKMAVEFDYYLASRQRWFCHVDDDVYLNVPRLVEMLKRYNHKEDWYLGKPSLRHPLEVMDRENPGMKLTFWFATGGAGFCISRSLALKMAPYAGGGRFMTTAENIRLPDDCTIGYIIEYLLKHKLTVVEEFHSHLEALWLIKSHLLDRQVTLSFSEYSGKQNVINIQGFSEKDDPTRFKSLHCYLFPNFRECRSMSPR